MEIVNFVQQLGGIITGLFKLVGVLFTSIFNGFQFFISSLSTIPNYIFDILNSLPSFFQIGLTGVFGLIIGITILKVVSIVFIQGG